MSVTAPVTYPSGARRGSERPLYHLVPPQALRRLAERATLGARAYGAANWRRGLTDAAFVAQLLNHLEEHWLRFRAGGDAGDDDNLAAIMWGCAALMEVERLAPATLRAVLVEGGAEEGRGGWPD